MPSKYEMSKFLAKYLEYVLLCRWYDVCLHKINALIQVVKNLLPPKNYVYIILLQTEVLVLTHILKIKKKYVSIKYIFTSKRFTYVQLN